MKFRRGKDGRDYTQVNIRYFLTREDIARIFLTTDRLPVSTHDIKRQIRLFYDGNNPVDVLESDCAHANVLYDEVYDCIVELTKV